MKALSLWQPWASAILLGHKRIETRHWSTRYRGPLLIHAAKKWDRDLRETAEIGGLPADLPLGALICTAMLVDIRPTEQLAGISADERWWGNYGPGRFGWLLEDVEPLPAPIPYKGLQGLFDVPNDALACRIEPARMVVLLPPPTLPPPPRQGSLF